jgi:histidyl-tRNA synthetase
LAEQLREALPDLRLIMDCSGGGFASQLKHADKSGARVALVLGEEEARTRQVGFKPLRNDAEQVNVSWESAAARLEPWLG